jgi:hypothetical protein
MFEQIIELNARAAAQGDYEAAYHLLMAALHCADHARDQQALELLTKLACEQGAAVEAIEPAHHPSRSHAKARGQTALYESLLTHIDAVRLRIDSARQLEKQHRRASA